MTKFYLPLLAFCLLTVTASAQKTFIVRYLDQIPILDGRLSDSCWLSANSTDYFTTSYPSFGNTPDQPTQVWLYRTDDAIYIAAFCATKKLRNDGTSRDNSGTGDWFRVGFDTWNDDQNAFFFQISASGVQYDAQRGGNQSAANWDAVWQSAVANTAEGWSLEMRIPFTALRFPAHGDQHWGLQFTRFERSTGFRSTWNPQDPLIGDEVLQYGQLEGLGVIHQKARRSITVFEDAERIKEVKSTGFLIKDELTSFTTGVDGRVGLGSNTTLDVTLFPAFTMDGEEPFEIKYSGFKNADLPEPRQLQAEAEPMFNKGGSLWRYPGLSRLDFLRYLETGESFYKISSPVLNTMKLSSRLRHNVGIGIENVLIGPTQAYIYNSSIAEYKLEKLRPFSTYTFLTAEKILPNNSWVNFSNATLRAGPGPNNNISSLDFQLRDPRNRFEVAGNGQLDYNEYAPGELQYTYQYNFSLAKVNGPWTWAVEHRSPTQFLYSTSPSTTASFERRHYQTSGLFHRWAVDASIYRYWSDKPNINNTLVLSTGGSVLSRRFQAFSIHFGLQPYRKQEPLSIGGNSQLIRLLSLPAQFAFSASTDQRKQFICQVNWSSSFNLKGEEKQFYLSVNPVWVINRHFLLKATNGLQNYSGRLEYLEAAGGGLLFKRSSYASFLQSIQGNWFVHPKFNLFFVNQILAYAQRKEEIVQLLPGQMLKPYPDYPFQKSATYERWTIDFGLQWQFAPGSQLRVGHSFHLKYIQNISPAEEYFYQVGLNEMTTNLSFICLFNAGPRQSERK